MLICLIRHASAGSRGRWSGPEEKRPLDERGAAQAVALADELAATDPAPGLLVSSRFLRCRQTLEPLGARLGLDVRDEPALAEGTAGDTAVDALLDLVTSVPGGVVAACSHGDVIPLAIEEAARRGAAVDGPGHLAKGARYELEVAGGRIVRARFVARPEV